MSRKYRCILEGHPLRGMVCDSEYEARMAWLRFYDGVREPELCRNANGDLAVRDGAFESIAFEAIGDYKEDGVTHRLKNEEQVAFPWNQSGEPGLTKLEYAAIHIAAGMAANPNPPAGGIIAAAYHTARGLLAQCEEAQ